MSMGNREATPMEKAFDRFLAEVRSLDKILWSYSSGPRLKDQLYPLGHYRHLEEQVNDTSRAWRMLQDLVLEEGHLAIHLEHEKHPVSPEEKIREPISPTKK